MVNLIRKYQQSLMVFVTIIVIVCFVWFYNANTTPGARSDADIAGVVYGRGVTRAEFVRMNRKLEICQGLGLNDMLRALGTVGDMGSRSAYQENFIWNSFVLRREAADLGIQPTEAEIVEEIQKLPAFVTNGVYDSSRYNQFVQLGLTPRGFTTDQLEEVVADSLRLEKIKELIGATDEPATAEVRSMYERSNQKTDASVVRLKLDDFKKDVKVTDEELQKRFEEQKGSLQHPEKRKVKVVAFTSPQATPPLEGKARVDAMQKLADTAAELAVAMTDKGTKLEDAAAKLGGTVVETPEFEAVAAPKELGHSPVVAEAAFKLTLEEPNSDVVTTEGGYYVMQLTGITPAKPKTFDEAKAQLTENLVQERATEAMTLKASEIRKKITEAIAAGKSFADAAKDAGAVAETFPTFSPAEPKFDQPDSREISMRSTDLNVGELSDFTPTATGGLLVFIEKRLPIDEAAFEKEKTMFSSNIERLKKEAAFHQWLKERRLAAGIVEAKS